MEWILSFVLVVFLIGTGVLCQDCLPIVEGSSFWVEEGNPFVVNCSLSNCQSRTVGTQWWMNGERVYRKDFTKRIYETKYIRRSKLVINPVKPEDAGTFTCINDVDSSKNVSIKLNVGVPYLTTQTTSTASQLLQSWMEDILLIFIVYTLSKI